MTPVEVFFSYAHEDDIFRQKLIKQLAALKRQGIIDFWNDCDISAGSEWEREINEHLNTAQIILLLVSPDFMASDYCYGIEMKRAMERHDSGGARVIPIILRPVHWQEAPFGKLQALPKKGKPVTDQSWHNLDNAFYSVAEGIRQAAKELLTHQMLNEGKAYYDQKLYEKALNVFEQITHIDPNGMDAYNYKGDIFSSLAQQARNRAEEYEELSQQAYEKVLQLGGSPTKNREDFYQRVEQPHEKLSLAFTPPVDSGETTAMAQAFRAAARQHSKKDDSDETLAYENVDPRLLRQAMVSSYSFDDLYILGIDLGVDFEQIHGNTDVMRAQGLIEYCRYNDMYGRLVTQVLADHPRCASELNISPKTLL